MALLDRILTIVVTATITSLIWIVAGPSLLDYATRSRPAAGGADRPLPPAQPLVGPPSRGAQRSLVSGEKARGIVAPGAALMIPVSGIAPAALSDTWNAPRGDGTRQHEAIDIMAPTGTPVLAAGAGVVEKLFLSGDGGKTVYVRVPDGRTIHYYAHLDAYAPTLREGQRIARGQILGTVGATGNADPSGPHLHFAIFRTTPEADWYESAAAINPYPLLTGRL